MKARAYVSALLLPALVINENVIHWALAVGVGGHSLVGGFQDAFQYFSVGGYLFFTAFRLVPYALLGVVVGVLTQTKLKPYVPAVLTGGLVGILAIIIWGLWGSLQPFYTDAHVSSTTAIAFLFIPIMAIPAGAIGAVSFALLYGLFCAGLMKGKARRQG